LDFIGVRYAILVTSCLLSGHQVEVFLRPLEQRQGEEYATPGELKARSPFVLGGTNSAAHSPAQTIFQSVEELLSFHSGFLTLLEERIGDNWNPEHSRLGEVFKVPLFRLATLAAYAAELHPQTLEKATKHYESFILNYPAASSTLDEWYLPNKGKKKKRRFRIAPFS
jgi:hypothetical protein